MRQEADFGCQSVSSCPITFRSISVHFSHFFINMPISKLWNLETIFTMPATTAGQNDRRKSPENVSEEEEGAYWLSSQPGAREEEEDSTDTIFFLPPRRRRSSGSNNSRNSCSTSPRAAQQLGHLRNWSLEVESDGERRRRRRRGDFSHSLPDFLSAHATHSAASIIRGERRTNGCNFSFMTTVDGAEWSEKSEWGVGAKGG